MTTTNWDASKHPRDEKGQFTFSDGSSNTSKEEVEKAKMQRRADILYPTMKDKKADGVMTGGAASMKQYNKEYIEKLQNSAQTDSDKSFLNNLDYILETEGGYNNEKGDVPTNLGVTQGIYDTYRKENRLPLQSVKNIKIEEAVPIYYKYFWKPSGAENLSRPLDLVYFDMYVNSNPKDAKNVLSRSDNDVNKFIENRRKYYDDVIKAKPIKARFKKGWNNRLDKLQKYADNYNSNSQDNK